MFWTKADPVGKVTHLLIFNLGFQQKQVGSNQEAGMNNITSHLLKTSIKAKLNILPTRIRTIINLKLRK